MTVRLYIYSKLLRWRRNKRWMHIVNKNIFTLLNVTYNGYLSVRTTCSSWLIVIENKVDMYTETCRAYWKLYGPMNFLFISASDNIWFTPSFIIPVVAIVMTQTLRLAISAWRVFACLVAFKLHSKYNPHTWQTMTIISKQMNAVSSPVVHPLLLLLFLLLVPIIDLDCRDNMFKTCSKPSEV